MLSNRDFIKGLLLSILMSMSVTVAYCQEFINIRKISVTVGDTSVVAGVLANVKIEKVRSDVFYYWYSNGQIYCNQGGYSGNLLHGEYTEYNKAGKLILKGMYERGLKSGEWTYWHDNGAIKEEIVYDEGLIEGINTRYSKNGKIIYSANYKKNILHGEMTRLVNDTLFQIKYKKGVEKKRIPLHAY